MDVSEVDSVLDLFGKQDEEEKLGYLNPSEFYFCIKDFDFNIFTATRINKASTMHGPITNPVAPLGQTCSVGIRVGLCRAISSFNFKL
ncbi:hypothetical protein DPMN_127031 [Dreissena polymorpha]|uniref:Uncharacterized protein n=1 Tax=Dreissena polymorpha TaxID=45954 RepID=A0A9D4GY73_DREPO|nr:hypothetical protein DPMN_127009 [Dreissena polymorpha]KAH3825158.1 hypothetical protein DPMN_127031 [Dreissena polymorpha]